MRIIIDRDTKGQPYIQWEQVPGIFKRAWIQTKNVSDEKNWANVPDGRYLNVVRVGDEGDPAGNPTDFPVFSELPDHQILRAFVYSVCGITGVVLDEEEHG